MVIQTYKDMRAEVLGTLVGEIKAGRMDPAGRIVIVNHRGEVVA